MRPLGATGDPHGGFGAAPGCEQLERMQGVRFSDCGVRVEVVRVEPGCDRCGHGLRLAFRHEVLAGPQVCGSTLAMLAAHHDMISGPISNVSGEPSKVIRSFGISELVASYW